MNNTIFDFSSAPAAPAGGSFVPMVALVVVGLIVLVLFVGLAMTLRRMLGRPELHGLSQEQIRVRWQEIETISQTGLMGAKMAVVEADNLLDSALKSLMMPGETMGERLKFAGYKYPEIRHVWTAHRLRNQVVHEATFELTIGQARAAIHDFKKALKTLNVL